MRREEIKNGVDYFVCNGLAAAHEARETVQGSIHEKRVTGKCKHESWRYDIDVPCVFLEDSKESVKQARRFSLQVGQRKNRMVPWDNREGRFVLFRPLESVSKQ